MKKVDKIRQGIAKICLMRVLLCATFVILLVASCAFLRKETASSMRNNSFCCVDTFEVKYQIVLGGGKTRKVADRFYVGFLKDLINVDSNKYNPMIFGDSVNEVIGFVRQNEEALFYRDKKLKNDKPFLFFERNKGDEWIVDIGNGYLWKKVVVFLGTEYDGETLFYTYGLNTMNGYTSVGNEIARIYYSKEKGFLKFRVKTHWGTTTVISSRSGS